MTVFQLAERAQVAYIEKAGDKIADVQSALAAPIRRPPPPPSLDRSSVRFDRTMNFTVNAKNLQPADRLFWADVAAEIDDGWNFVQSRNFEDQNREIRVAQIMRTQALEFGAEAGIDVPGASTLGLSGSNNTTTQVSQNLDFEVVPFAPTLSESEASFYLQALFPQINVAGTYAVTVTMETSPENTKTVPVFRFNTKAGEESVTQYYWEVAKAVAGPVTVNVRMPYRLRHVVKNAHTIEERDDTVVWFDGNLASFGDAGSLVDISSGSIPEATAQAIIDESDIREDVFIAQLVSSDPAKESKLVKLYDPARHPGQDVSQCIGTSDAEELRAFLNWVNSKPSERIEFKRGDRTLYKLVYADRPNENIELNDRYQLRVTRYALNYKSKFLSNEIPDLCTTLQ